MESPLRAGKLPLEMLSQILGRVEIRDPRVLLGPAAGEDAALIDFGDRYLVAKTDPVTFATDLIGWYVVHVNANDLAAMGATPRWLMATLLLPEGTTGGEAQAIFDQMLEACEGLNVALVGGHTEITYGLPRPLVVGAMLGEVVKDRVVLTSGAQVGDAIVLTKGIAIEGTAILAREAEDRLRAAGVAEDLIQKAKGMLFDPGISVVRDAAVACEAADVHAMHDPTEGGLATALREVATAAGVGLATDLRRLPVVDECRTICEALELDPLGLIASGALLLTVRAEDAPAVIDGLEGDGISAWNIGRVVVREEGLTLQTEDGIVELPSFERDELARFFGA